VQNSSGVLINSPHGRGPGPCLTACCGLGKPRMSLRHVSRFSAPEPHWRKDLMHGRQLRTNHPLLHAKQEQKILVVDAKSWAVCRAL
jgi:hypothetical protein